jgi:hypothetical protein
MVYVTFMVHGIVSTEAQTSISDVGTIYNIWDVGVCAFPLHLL